MTNHPDPGDNVTHIAPQDLAAERYVLGAALQAPTALAACIPLVTPADFYHPNHETIWHTLLELHTADMPTEPQALLAALRENGTLTRIGGGPYLHALIQDTGNPLHGPHYARQVAQLARRRAALTAVEQARHRLQEPTNGDDTDELLTTVADTITEAARALANPNPTTTWAPANLEPALDGRSLDPPPDMLQRSDGVHLFYSGAVHTIAGESESGKTWVALLAAKQLMDAALNVNFIDYEDRAERVVGRLMSLGATRDNIRQHFTYIRPDRPLDNTGRNDLRPALELSALCIIDGVTEAMNVHGYDTNSNDDIAKFYALLPRFIADQGPAVVMIDHVTKNSETRGRYALGGQHKLAGIDGAAYTVKVVAPFGRGKRGKALIHIAKDRAGFVREHARGHLIAEFILDDTAHDNTTNTATDTLATLDPPGADQAAAGEPTDRFIPTEFMKKISEYLERVVAPQSTNAIMLAIPGKEKQKRQAVQELAAGGYITVTPGPRNANMYQHARHYPDIDPTHQPTLNTPE